jgi:hypothetical protein
MRLSRFDAQNPGFLCVEFVFFHMGWGTSWFFHGTSWTNLICEKSDSPIFMGEFMAITWVYKSWDPLCFLGFFVRYDSPTGGPQSSDRVNRWFRKVAEVTMVYGRYFTN